MPVPHGESVALPTRRLLSDDVFDRLRDDIVRGYLAGGQKIHDLELAQAMGMSRATVRSAILRLTQVSLVEAVPNLYTRVTEIDVDRYLQTQDTARTLFVFATRFGVPLMRPEHVRTMNRWSRGLGSRDAVDPEGVFSGTAGRGFFDVLVDSTQNVPLAKTLSRLRPTIQRVVGQHAHFLPALELDTAMLEVVDAIGRRDADQAALRLGAMYDGPLETFHERLRELV